MEAQSSKYAGNHNRINVEEKIISLFEPDTLVSRLIIENFQKDPHSAEKRLMLAVLEDAINCFQVNVMARSGTKKLFNESEDWIMGWDDDWIFRL
jgi:hypothetical protein